MNTQAILRPIFGPIAVAVLAGILVSSSPLSADIYEPRTYTTNEGKLKNLNARFRDHTVRLFKKHGMESATSRDRWYSRSG